MGLDGIGDLILTGVNACGYLGLELVGLVVLVGRRVE